MSSWDSKKLLLKAKLFIDRANQNDQASAEFAYWSALSLECLARSALTSIHPVLNADPRDDVNLLYAFGFELTAKPRSLPAHSVYIRLEKVISDFGPPQRELCEFVALQRNAHLHTADLPYENLKPTKWLPRFYDTIQVLLKFIGLKLEDFLGDEMAVSATKLITTLNDKLIGTVKKKIAEHRAVFDAKTDEEKAAAIEAGKVPPYTAWGSEMATCPACGNEGLLDGTIVKQFPEKYEHESLSTDVQFLGTSFKCATCGLALKGVEEVTHAGMDIYFVHTASTSLHDLYEPDHYLEYDNM